MGFEVCCSIEDDIGVLNLLVFWRREFFFWGVFNIEFWNLEFFDVGGFSGLIIEGNVKWFLIIGDFFIGEWFFRKDVFFKGELLIGWLDIGVRVLLFNIWVWIGCFDVKGVFMLFCSCKLGFGRSEEFWRLLLSCEKLFLLVKFENVLLFFVFFWLLVRRNFCIILFKIEFLLEFLIVWLSIWWISFELFWVGIGLNLLSFLLFNVLLRLLKLLGVLWLYSFVFNDFSKGIIFKLWCCFLCIFRSGLLF